MSFSFEGANGSSSRMHLAIDLILKSESGVEKNSFFSIFVDRKMQVLQMRQVSS